VRPLRTAAAAARRAAVGARYRGLAQEGAAACVPAGRALGLAGPRAGPRAGRVARGAHWST
jgi:hypothetical protein